jgi:hypothetical protein
MGIRFVLVVALALNAFFYVSTETANAIRSPSGLIVRHVMVNRHQNPKQAISVTGCVKDIEDGVLATMPQASTAEEDVYFFKLEPGVSAEEVDREYQRRGLVPDPYAQIQVNIDDRSFAADHPNATQWNTEGKYSSFIAFDHFGYQRNVIVARVDTDWHYHMWFGGVRKYLAFGD